MIRAYFDSSAIIKLSKEEPESLRLVEYFEEKAVEACTSVVAEIEVIRNLRRHQLGDQHAVTGFYLVALDDDVRQRALEITEYSLRSLDAIHIATAMSIADRHLEFVTYDDRQAAAARAVGLNVIQPGR